MWYPQTQNQLLRASKPGGSQEQGGLLPIRYAEVWAIAGQSGNTRLRVFAREVGM